MNISFDEALKRGWITPQEVPKRVASKGGATRKRKSEAEGEEQAELVAWFRATFPEIGALLIHIPNGGSRRNAYEGWRLKQQGVRAGVSDLLLPVARGGYFGLWLEFKATPPDDAAITESQLEWQAAMQAQGYRAEICLGIEAAKALLTAYMQTVPTKAGGARKPRAAKAP